VLGTYFRKQLSFGRNLLPRVRTTHPCGECQDPGRMRCDGRASSAGRMVGSKRLGSVRGSAVTLAGRPVRVTRILSTGTTEEIKW